MAKKEGREKVRDMYGKEIAEKREGKRGLRAEQ